MCKPTQIIGLIANNPEIIGSDDNWRRRLQILFYVVRKKTWPIFQPPALFAQDQQHTDAGADQPPRLLRAAAHKAREGDREPQEAEAAALSHQGRAEPGRGRPASPGRRRQLRTDPGQPHRQDHGQPRRAPPLCRAPRRASAPACARAGRLSHAPAQRLPVGRESACQGPHARLPRPRVFAEIPRRLERGQRGRGAWLAAERSAWCGDAGKYSLDIDPVRFRSNTIGSFRFYQAAEAALSCFGMKGYCVAHTESTLAVVYLCPFHLWPTACMSVSLPCHETSSLRASRVDCVYFFGHATEKN